jgi:UTP pyrophosphatase
LDDKNARDGFMGLLCYPTSSFKKYLRSMSPPVTPSPALQNTTGLTSRQPKRGYLNGYPVALRQQVQQLIEQGKLANHLIKKYGSAHAVRSDRSLYDYVMALKNEFLRSSEPVSKVVFDGKLNVLSHALGTHTTASRLQGGKLKAKREIRVARLFINGPDAFLRMIAVHELAHLKEREHDRAFYALCCHMEPQYHQYEFDLRAYLSFCDLHPNFEWPQ